MILQVVALSLGDLEILPSQYFATNTLSKDKNISVPPSPIEIDNGSFIIWGHNFRHSASHQRRNPVCETFQPSL